MASGAVGGMADHLVPDGSAERVRRPFCFGHRRHDCTLEIAEPRFQLTGRETVPLPSFRLPDVILYAAGIMAVAILLAGLRNI